LYSFFSFENPKYKSNIGMDYGCRLGFGIAVVLLIAATSMSKRQAYGEGWLNGECYLVKKGTYAGLAILILVTVGSLIGSGLLTMKTNKADQGHKIHAQTGETRE